VAEVPVAFQVVNTDTSGAPCNPARPSDGRPYTVRGHLTGPRAALLAQRSGAVTLYLFGYEGGEWNWDLKNVSGYDYAAEMARLGTSRSPSRSWATAPAAIPTATTPAWGRRPTSPTRS